MKLKSLRRQYQMRNQVANICVYCPSRHKEKRKNAWPFSTATVTVPEPTVVSEQQSPYAFSTGLKAIKSISIKPPSLNQWYGSMVINFQSGESSPPLWFHDDESPSTILQRKAGQEETSERDNNNTVWGGDEIIKRLAGLVNVQKYVRIFLLGKFTVIFIHWA